MALMMPPKDLRLSNNFATNLVKVCPYLWKQERLQGFYKGLAANLMKTGLSTAVYFYFLRLMEHFLNEKNFLTSFMVSSFSRVLGTIASNPFNIIKTRFELAG